MIGELQKQTKPYQSQFHWFRALIFIVCMKSVEPVCYSCSRYGIAWSGYQLDSTHRMSRGLKSLLPCSFIKRLNNKNDNSLRKGLATFALANNVNLDQFLVSQQQKGVH